MLKKILLSLSLFSTSVFANDPYLLIHGISYHKKVKNNHTEYNQVNTGLGIGYEFNSTLKPFIEVGTYKDSYSEQAYYAMTGVRYALLDTSIKPYIKLNTGYLNGSGFNSIIAYPSFTIECDTTSP